MLGTEMSHDELPPCTQSNRKKYETWGWGEVRCGLVLGKGQVRKVRGMKTEKEMLKNRVRPGAEQEAWARVVWGRQRRKATNETNKTHGHVASGSHGSLFSWQRNTGLSSVITYALCLGLFTAIYLQNLFSPHSSANNSVALNIYSVLFVSVSIGRQTPSLSQR